MDLERKPGYWEKRSLRAEQLLYRFHKAHQGMRHQWTLPWTNWKGAHRRKCSFCHESAPVVSEIQHKSGCVVPPLEALIDEFNTFWTGDSSD